MNELPILYPTLPGKAPGIIGWEPLRMQCGDCGAIHEQCHRSVGACILTAGYEFHTCETGAPRRCPSCLARALTECGSTRCADQLREAPVADGTRCRMSTPYVPAPKLENPAPQPPEYGDHKPTMPTVLATIRARIDQWQAKQEQR